MFKKIKSLLLASSIISSAFSSDSLFHDFQTYIPLSKNKVVADSTVQSEKDTIFLSRESNQEINAINISKLEYIEGLKGYHNVENSEIVKDLEFDAYFLQRNLKKDSMTTKERIRIFNISDISTYLGQETVYKISKSAIVKSRCDLNKLDQNGYEESIDTITNKFIDAIHYNNEENEWTVRLLKEKIELSLIAKEAKTLIDTLSSNKNYTTNFKNLETAIIDLSGNAKQDNLIGTTTKRLIGLLENKFVDKISNELQRYTNNICLNYPDETNEYINKKITDLKNYISEYKTKFEEFSRESDSKKIQDLNYKLRDHVNSFVRNLETFYEQESRDNFLSDSFQINYDKTIKQNYELMSREEFHQKISPKQK